MLIKIISCVAEKTVALNIQTLPSFEGGEVIECKELKQADIYVSTNLSPFGMCVGIDGSYVNNISVNDELVLNSTYNDCICILNYGNLNVDFVCNYDDN
jgi:hypothetical protein